MDWGGRITRFNDPRTRMRDEKFVESEECSFDYDKFKFLTRITTLKTRQSQYEGEGHSSSLARELALQDEKIRDREWMELELRTMETLLSLKRLRLLNLF